MRRFRQTIRIMFSDCDPAQIVYYPTYFRWFDRGTQAMFNEVGMEWSKCWPELGLAGFPIVDVSARFMGPARMDDEVTLDTWVEEWRGRTFVVKHLVTKDGKPIAEGQEVRVWAALDREAPEGIRAAPIPDEVKERFA